MADNNHTPGPWFVFNDGKCVGGPESTVGAGQGIAMCSMRARSDEEAKANARLIAAAPEMFDALKGVVASWEKFYPFLPVSREVEDAEFDEFNKARAAICGALGLQPWDYHELVAQKAGA